MSDAHNKPKERPILFSAPMVRAILEGRKTVTRRVIKPVRGYEENSTCRPDKAAANHSVWWHGKFETCGVMQHCPYGQPGDRLWVRETWLPDPDADSEAWDDHTDTYVSWSGCGSRIDGVPPALRKPEHCIYREGWDGGGLVWRPSIHMPRWASRILLEITGVRVERLQDISPAQVTAEGVSTRGAAMWGDQWWVDAPDQAIEDARKDFADLWTSTGGDWEANPWVWVVEFKQVKP